MNTTRQLDARTQDIWDTTTSSDIREWRESIETFFDEDWTRLSVIIERLEESLWPTEESEDVSLQQSDQNSSAGNQADCQAQLDALAKTTVPVSSDPEQKQRLENLAKKIEERLNHSGTQNKKDSTHFDGSIESQ